MRTYKGGMSWWDPWHTIAAPAGSLMGEARWTHLAILRWPYVLSIAPYKPSLYFWQGTTGNNSIWRLKHIETVDVRSFFRYSDYQTHNIHNSKNKLFGFPLIPGKYTIPPPKKAITNPTFRKGEVPLHLRHVPTPKWFNYLNISLNKTPHIG